MKLEWNVYREDFNNKEIKVFNIFNHGRFDEDVKKDLKECKIKEEFSEKLKKNLRYYYWSKSEYEIVLTSWTPRIEKEELDRLNREYEEYYNKYNHAPYNILVEPNVFKKVDICEQVMLNYNVFVDYIWNKKGE